MTTKAKPRRKATEVTMAAVVAHPLRARAFMHLAERTASPNEISKSLRENVNDVAYHVRKLHEWRLIEQVDTRPVRGAVEHFYRATVRPWLHEKEYAELSHDDRNGLVSEVCQLIFADVATAVDSKSFSTRTDSQVVRVPVLVDGAGFNEISEIYDETLDRILEVQAASAARMGQSGEDGIQAEAVHLLFERDVPPRPVTT